MKWTKEEIKLSIEMINEGKSFVEISQLLGRTQISVTKKLNRLGYKSGYSPSGCYGVDSKYSTYDWGLIQKQYDEGLSYRDLIEVLNLTPQAIKWGVDNHKMVFRSISDGMKLAWENGKFKLSDKIGVERYRQLCSFKFNVYDYPEYFNLTLIDDYGWYKAKNKGDNPNGVSRDHMFSVKEGYENNIDPYYISHPANCELLIHCDNNLKKTKCSISIEELYFRVEKWDNKNENEV